MSISGLGSLENVSAVAPTSRHRRTNAETGSTSYAMPKAAACMGQGLRL